MTKSAGPNLKDVNAGLNQSIVPPPDDPGWSAGGGSEIYEGSPVTPLGVFGNTFFYLDMLGQLRPVIKHDKDTISALFGGRTEGLWTHYPQFAKGSNHATGWAQEKTREAMQRACSDKGVWNAFDKVRGLGAWADQDGGVILHCGDQILHKGQWHRPGEIENYVYPSFPRIARPIEEFTDTGGKPVPGAQLLDLLNSWKFMRGDIDAIMLLGWIVAAMFGGALKWRPMVWITGSAGTGKSTLHDLINHVMGDGSLLQATDATEAGIRQMLGQATIPVALDELEAETDPRKTANIIKLARQASSGGKGLRGGADHKGQEFIARSCFLFSSILIPPLLDQDIVRNAVLELNQLERGAIPPPTSKRAMNLLGRKLRTVAIDEWDRMAETLEQYRMALHRVGHTARGCDQYGTLLAMADMVMYGDAPDPARCDQWARKLMADDVADQMDKTSDWEQMLAYLMEQPMPYIRGGTQNLVGEYVLVAIGLEDWAEPKAAERALRQIGIKVFGRMQSAQLAIANKHAGLGKLFEGTRWQSGVWSQSARRIPRAVSTTGLSFGAGPRSRCQRFPMASIEGFFGENDVPKATQSSQAPQSPDPVDPDDFI